MPNKLQQTLFKSNKQAAGEAVAIVVPDRSAALLRSADYAATLHRIWIN
jgi:hypothetical protein